MDPIDGISTAPSSRSDAAAAASRAGAVRRFAGRRTKKPKLLAVVTDACTGCAGAPVCEPYCPVEDCMVLVAAADAPPFGRIVVDPLRCVGCRKCLTSGPDDTVLDGCPWNAIVMIPTDTWEATHGVLAY